MKKFCYIWENFWKMLILKIGNIVTDGIFENPDLFNVVKDFSQIEPNKPTLIIGWSKANTIFSGLSILENKINDNTWWTFGKRERNYKYQEDTIAFRKLAMETIEHNITYKFVNIFGMPTERKRKMFDWLTSGDMKKAFVSKGMLYVNQIGRNDIIGMSLRDIDFEGGNSKKLLAMMHNGGKVSFIRKNDDNVPQDVLFALRNNAYLVPYLFES